jgi:ABC-type Fe3+-hydroxamate transport system substrate-binding protein
LQKQTLNKPSVLTEIKYGDAWYIPAGKSFIAHLIEDAGGNYFWKEDTKTGSSAQSFEILGVPPAGRAFGTRFLFALRNK